ncbi:MAG: hypothetical protein NTW20_15115 [Rhodobacterales bacterium]|nr:hypothetical protein [Rhodobacterales bacterium]
MMDLNRLFTMLYRMVFRSAVNTGVDVASRGGKAPEDMTPEERKAARANREMAAKAKRTLRMGRRFFR